MSLPFPPHLRNQIIGAVIVALIGVLGLGLWTCLIPGLKKCVQEGAQATPVHLEFWSVYEDSDVYIPFIQKFSQRYPNVTISYTKKEYDPYRKERLQAFTEGKAPDIFAIHNTWLPLEEKRLAPVPEDLLSFAQFKDMFPDVVRFDFTRQEGDAAPRIYALPLFVDTLALFYNRTYFNNQNFITPPATWDDFADYTKKLTRYTADGSVDLAGASIGTAKNINRSTDLLGLIMMQTGTRMTDEKFTQATFAQDITSGDKKFPSGLGAFEFYLSFADPKNAAYTWDAARPYSIDAFLQGDAAMLFNYSYQIPVLERKNRYLDFAVAPVPQPKDQREKITFANYWGLGVSKDSANKEMAWKFILFLLEEENAKQYLQTVHRPTSLRALIPWQRETASDRLKPFVDQILQARSWYEGDSVQAEQILADAVEAAVAHDKEPREALGIAANEITTIFQKVRLGVIQ